VIDCQTPLKIADNVNIKVLDENGEVIQEENGHNLIVDQGLNIIRNLLTGIGDDDYRRIDKMAVGTGSTAVSAGQTTLVGEVYRTAVTDYDVSTSKRVIFVLNLPTTAANSVTLREVGLFNGAGTMFARFVHAAITKTASKSVVYTWTIDLGATEA
jgi:hypothetical protein